MAVEIIKAISLTHIRSKQRLQGGSGSIQIIHCEFWLRFYHRNSYYQQKRHKSHLQEEKIAAERKLSHVCTYLCSFFVLVTLNFLPDRLLNYHWSIVLCFRYRIQIEFPISMYLILKKTCYVVTSSQFKTKF